MSHPVEVFGRHVPQLPASPVVQALVVVAVLLSSCALSAAVRGVAMTVEHVMIGLVPAGVAFVFTGPHYGAVALWLAGSVVLWAPATVLVIECADSWLADLWAAQRTAVAGRGSGAEDGFMAVEVAILAVVFVVMLVFVVGLGRVSHARQLVDQASAAAARAGALDRNPGAAGGDARQAASDTLEQSGVSCARLDVAVDTGAFRAGGYVDVTVRCTADLRGLTVAGMPGSVTLTATSRSPLETYRDLS